MFDPTTRICLQCQSEMEISPVVDDGDGANRLAQCPQCFRSGWVRVTRSRPDDLLWDKRREAAQRERIFGRLDEHTELLRQLSMQIEQDRDAMEKFHDVLKNMKY